MSLQCGCHNKKMSAAIFMYLSFSVKYIIICILRVDLLTAMNSLTLTQILYMLEKLFPKPC